MGLTVELVEGLLLIAAIAAMLARRARIPYTVVLVLAGIAIALAPASLGVSLTKDLIFRAFLPPLVFEAAFNIPWAELRKDLPVVSLLATVGVAFSAAVTTAGMHLFAGWEWTAALLFGVLIAATDPVAVIATFKEAGLKGRLRLLVESESLLNDGTAAVAFAIALAVTQGSTVGAAGIVQAFLLTVAGGILCGAVVGFGAALVAGRTEDHLVEITFTTVAAYGSFLLAEHFHLSGVLAALTAGLILGNVGSLGSFSDTGRDAVESAWEYIAFVANSLIFLLMGVRLAQEHFAGTLIPVIWSIMLVTLGRAFAVYPCLLPFARSRLRVDIRQQHILFWGGLRGALALALALGLPPTVPRRAEITAVAFAVVAFSVVVQGLTIAPLLRRYGFIAGSANTDRVQ